MGTAKKNKGFTLRLEEAIKRSGLGHTEFARNAGIGYSTLMNYLNKDNVGRVPQWHVLLKISHFTNRTIEWFLTGEGNGSAPTNVTFSKASIESYQVLKKIVAEANQAASENFSSM
jgi:transcriptional regulator with XRE-family HTH domain